MKIIKSQMPLEGIFIIIDTILFPGFMDVKKGERYTFGNWADYYFWVFIEN